MNDKNNVQKRLAKYQQQNLLRARIIAMPVNNSEIIIENKKCISFCSNDYLGLAQHPHLIAAAKAGLEQYGVGSTGSALISGYRQIHQQLENEIAEFLGYERALLFTSGYMANLGVLQALTSRFDTVFADKANHASLVDAIQLTKVNYKRYPHGNLACLTNNLASSTVATTWVVSDSVFSMDGDIAPVAELLQLAQQYQANTIIDDSHGIGIIGKTGRGIIEHAHLTNKNLPILTFSLAKAFACTGGIVAGTASQIQALLQFSRTQIYTSAIAPVMACAALASLHILQQETWRREKLTALITFFIQAAAERRLKMISSITPIQSLVIGDEAKTIAISEQLLAKGFFVRAIRPPTVPSGTARLRITLNCLHTENMIVQLLDELAELFYAD